MSELYIYNVTSKVNIPIHENWLHWMKNEHIPEVLATGMFTHHRILKLREVDDSDGVTYAIQYFCSSLSHYERYLELFAGSMRAKVFEKWGNEVISFRTLMEVIN
jgi:hypothetical protein